MKVEPWNPDEDGPLTEVTLKRKLQLRGFHVTRYVYSPGTYFPDHTHGVDKIYAVLSGRFRMTTPLSGAQACDCCMYHAVPCTTRKSWAIRRS